MKVPNKIISKVLSSNDKVINEFKNKLFNDDILNTSQIPSVLKHILVTGRKM
jgi:hypothetical protein